MQTNLQMHNCAHGAKRTNVHNVQNLQMHNYALGAKSTIVNKIAQMHNSAHGAKSTNVHNVQNCANPQLCARCKEHNCAQNCTNAQLYTSCTGVAEQEKEEASPPLLCHYLQLSIEY